MKKGFLRIVLSVMILVLSICPLAQAQSGGTTKFSDISTHWVKDAVQNLLTKNAIPFNGDNFLPNQSIKKSEFAVMLHNALGIQIEYLKEPDVKDYFDDIKQDDSYASAVIDLVTANVFDSKGNFKPDSTVTKEEMIHYVMQAYKYEMEDNYAMIKINPATFDDVDEITPEFSGDVARAQHYLLISGNGNNLFQPKKEATRAEAAAVINKLIELLEKQNQQVTVTPKATLQDDSIEMKVVIKNNTKNDVTIENSTGQKFNIELLDANQKVLYSWDSDKAFTQNFTTTEIEAGKTLEFDTTLSGDAYKTIKDKIVYLKAYITGTASFIKTEGYEIKIK